jgi:serine/threonine protein phosphatase PrpC
MPDDPNVAVLDRCLLLDDDLGGPVELVIGTAEIVAFSARAPDRGDDPTEDAATVVPVGASAVLVVADGLGGLPGGRHASAEVIRKLYQQLTLGSEGEMQVRELVLDAIEQAHANLRDQSRVGETTLVVAEITEDQLRTYNVGDSAALVVGGGGKVKYQTIAHSPVGYGVAAGLLDQDEAMHHEQRHYVSNTLGSKSMSVEMSAGYPLAPRDTVVLGSDGLFDNLHLEEIADIVRKGPLREAAVELALRCRERMTATPVDGTPSKPDDLTFILCRIGRGA